MNSIEQFKTRVNDLIAGDKTEGAILLFQLHLKIDGSYYNTIISLKARFKRVTIEKINGTISRNKFNREKNKINYDLLELVKKIENEDLEFKLSSTQRKDKQKFQEVIDNLTDDFFKDFGKYKIIKKREERTKEIIEKLKILLEQDAEKLQNTIIRNSAFLTILAVDENEPFFKNGNTEELKYKELLLEEKRTLLSLLEKGCMLKIIISPANENYVRHAGIENSIHRTETLLKILYDKTKPIFDNIEWAISEYGYRNLYILDDKHIFEGHKNSVKVGYGITLYQSDQEIINSNINLFEMAFEDLSALTLCKWGKKNTRYLHRKELLKESAIEFLEKSVQFLKKWKNN